MVGNSRQGRAKKNSGFFRSKSPRITSEMDAKMLGSDLRTWICGGHDKKLTEIGRFDNASLGDSRETNEGEEVK